MIIIFTLTFFSLPQIMAKVLDLFTAKVNKIFDITKNGKSPVNTSGWLY